MDLKRRKREGRSALLQWISICYQYDGSGKIGVVRMLYLKNGYAKKLHSRDIHWHYYLRQSNKTKPYNKRKHCSVMPIMLQLFFMFFHRTIAPAWRNPKIKSAEPTKQQHIPLVPCCHFEGLHTPTATPQKKHHQPLRQWHLWRVRALFHKMTRVTRWSSLRVYKCKRTKNCKETCYLLQAYSRSKAACIPVNATCPSLWSQPGVPSSWPKIAVTGTVYP